MRHSKPKYFPISPLIIRPDSKSQFDIFLRHDNSYVLFNARGRTFTDSKRQELANNNVATVYIDRRALEQYRLYLLENIGEVLDDESIPLDERAQAWTATATALSRELFEEKLPGPTFEKRYERFESLIQSTSSFIQSPKSLKQLAKFIDKGYDQYHHGLSTMVYTISLLQEYDYDDYKTLACGMGALLHDIGKTGLPKEVTETDPVELSDDNFDILVLHPMIGARTCATFNLPTIASNCILFHHERADGKGYPTKATSDQLPLHTKVVSLCNVYDSLTRNLPYRRAFRPFEALKIIMEDPGLVDKDILKTFVGLLSKAKIA